MRVQRLFSRQIAFVDLCIVIVATFAALSATLLIWPAFVHWLFQIGSDPDTDLMSRRAGVLFAGLAVLIWNARLEGDSPLRRTVCLALIVAMGGMAILGLIELLRGAMGIGVLIAVTVELFFAARLFPFYRGAA